MTWLFHKVIAVQIIKAPSHSYKLTINSSSSTLHKRPFQPVSDQQELKCKIIGKFFVFAGVVIKRKPLAVRMLFTPGISAFRERQSSLEPRVQHLQFSYYYNSNYYTSK